MDKFIASNGVEDFSINYARIVAGERIWSEVG